VHVCVCGGGGVHVWACVCARMCVPYLFVKNRCHFWWRGRVLQTALRSGANFRGPGLLVRAEA